MHLDKQTLEDLSFFNVEDEYALFYRLDRSTTNGGRKRLLDLFRNGLPTPEQILAQQETVQYLTQHLSAWPVQVTNGTIVMLEKYLESNLPCIEQLHDPLLVLKAWITKNINRTDFNLIRFSVEQTADFMEGLEALLGYFKEKNTPLLLQQCLQQLQSLLQAESLPQIDKSRLIHAQYTLQNDHLIRRKAKRNLRLMMENFFRLDAWFSLARVGVEMHFTFPELVNSQTPLLETSNLFHPLLPEAVSYTIDADRTHPFLFLTGANMSGKSTFIRSLGAAVYMAHLGMAVPATHMRLSFYESVCTNINVTDNIFKGESYFFNEVQRVAATIRQISQPGNWLVLMDELFRGTNHTDALACSVTVMEGLLKKQNCIFVLSTHLHEVAVHFDQHPKIRFKYFETKLYDDDRFEYTYQLKDGVSNEKLGLLILKREGIEKLLA
jgi:DNA mismatch repair ATPase MutS